MQSRYFYQTKLRSLIIFYGVLFLGTLLFPPALKTIYRTISAAKIAVPCGHQFLLDFFDKHPIGDFYYGYSVNWGPLVIEWFVLLIIAIILYAWKFGKTNNFQTQEKSEDTVED